MEVRGGVVSTVAPGKVLKLVIFVVSDFFAQFGVWTQFLRFHAADVGHKHLQIAVPKGELNMNGTYVTNAMKSRHIHRYVFGTKNYESAIAGWMHGWMLDGCWGFTTVSWCQ